LKENPMRPFSPKQMLRVTELTKSGRLSEATALIQATLAGGLTPSTESDGPEVIEGSFTDLDTAGDQPPARPRRRLSETLRHLGFGKTPHRTPAAPLPEGATFAMRQHHSAQGQLGYKLYIPASRATAPMPLIVMLHGCTQSPDDFAAGTAMNALAEQHGFLVAYPEQTNAGNANKCWNWFRSEDQARGRGEPALLAAVVKDILDQETVDPARVYVAGLSAGGAAAAILGASYPDVFAAVAVHSGLAVGAATSMPQAFSAMRAGAKGAKLAQGVPTIVFHGLADATVSPANGQAVYQQALPAAPKQRVPKRITVNGLAVQQTIQPSNGGSRAELWEIEGLGHAWSGGSPAGTYTSSAGPDASAEFLRFFMQHRLA
jgi:poly(hydroxyalkanoate) depolymerase family esterase